MGSIQRKGGKKIRREVGRKTEKEIKQREDPPPPIRINNLRNGNKNKS